MSDDTSLRDDVTLLLQQAHDGNAVAAKRVLDLIWGDLRNLAGRQLAGDPNATIEPTAVVDECFVRLVGEQGCRFESRVHFFRTAANCMRRIVIDRARAAMRLKRGADAQPMTLDTRDLAPEKRPGDFLALDVALEKLMTKDERKHDVVLLRFFAGLTVEATAECLEISAATVKSDWAFARAWLQNELESA